MILSFIKEVILYGIAMAVVAVVITLALYHLPTKDLYNYYETPLVVRKLNYFLDEKNQFNTVFVGTSKTLRQINPTQFSAELGGEMEAFNMGAPGLFPFRLHDLARRTTQKEGLKNIFVEIAPLDRIGTNYHSNPNIYALNPERFGVAVDYVIKNALPIRTKLGYLLNYSKAMFYKYLGFGASKQLTLLIDFFKYPISGAEASTDVANRGFAPYSSFEKDGVLPKNLNLEHEAFLKAPRLKNTIESYKAVQKKSIALSDKYLSDLIALARHISEKGIAVYFILPPRQMDYGLPAVINQRDRLREAGFPVFDCSDPDIYPELYKVENSFDDSHLNDDGAAIFTGFLAKMYRKSLAQ